MYHVCHISSNLSNCPAEKVSLSVCKKAKRFIRLWSHTVAYPTHPLWVGLPHSPSVTAAALSLRFFSVLVSFLYVTRDFPFLGKDVTNVVQISAQISHSTTLVFTILCLL